MLHISLPRQRVSSIGLVSLETLADVFIGFLFIVTSDTNDQYLFNMLEEFMRNLESD